MSNKNTVKIEVEAIFSKVVLSKKGKTLVILSDGVSEKLFATPLETEAFTDLQRGDKILVDVTLNVFDDYATKVIAVQKI